MAPKPSQFHSESQHPDQAMEQWLQVYLADDADFDIEDVAVVIPEPLRQKLSHRLLYGDRIVSMWTGGNSEEAFFRIHERDRHPDSYPAA